MRLFIFLLPILFFIMGCSPSKPTPKQKKTVLVSVAPYAFFVKEIGQDQVDVKVLIPEKTNPHTYEPKPQDVAALFATDLWIRLNEPSEEKVYRVLREQKSHLTIVEITKDLPLLSACSHHHLGDHPEGKDLHVWLSPRLVKKQALLICDALIGLDPHNAAFYRKNLDSFLNRLDCADKEIATILKQSKSPYLLVSHPAFGYFCKDYGLCQLSMEIDGKDPLPQEIETLMRTVKEHRIQTIFLEPQYSTKGADLLAEKLHLSKETIDPYAEDYFENLKTIAYKIAKS